MIGLAFDTSTRTGSVALGRIAADGVEVLGRATLEVSATHSEAVLPAIDRCLGGAAVTAADLDAVVVGGGPGSFTGLRIGAALARGLCFSRRTGLYAYSSLAAIAAGTGATGDLCCLVDARRGQVYAAGYAVAPGIIEERFSPRTESLSDLLAALDPEAWTFAGLLDPSQRQAIERAGGGLLDPETGRPTGVGLLELLRLSPDAGRVAVPSSWEPEYVRASSAERRVGG